MWILRHMHGLTVDDRAKIGQVKEGQGIVDITENDGGER